MKKRFHYAVSGYRWAPENFHARKGIVGQPLKDVPLSPEERRQVGILFLTKGAETAIGYVKHIERAKERQLRGIITYGFRTKEPTQKFIYFPQLYCCSDAPLHERLLLFKKIRNALAEQNGKVVVSAECVLDGKYHPTNIKENTVTADFTRHLCIPMGKKMIRSGPERPYCPRQSGTQKVRPINTRKSTRRVR
ncbi:MAG: hypothetical protein K2M42_11075 [Oscillospiraceae bacterium]|nr:hypothetical protein [Oscillospiraceae bacterium]